MKKYKIHKGKKANNITDEQIMKHKNFDKLFISYNSSCDDTINWEEFKLAISELELSLQD